MEAGAWGKGAGGARNVGRISESLASKLVMLPRRLLRPIPVRQCALDTLPDPMCTCKGALNELFLAGRNKGFFNKEPARRQNFLWSFPIKSFALLTVCGVSQMSCESYGLGWAQN